jgi:hypothetical protein
MTYYIISGSIVAHYLISKTLLIAVAQWYQNQVKLQCIRIAVAQWYLNQVKHSL